MNTSPQSHLDDAEAGVRAVVEAWTQAIRTKDSAALLDLIAMNTVRFFLSPPLETEAPLPENVDSWFRSFEGELCYEVRQLNVTASGDLACTNSLNRLTGTKTGGGQMSLWFRQTLCLRVIEGRWRIIHIHESVPIYMDDGHRAAVDLQPTSLG